jgi:hypothetical protein
LFDGWTNTLNHFWSTHWGKSTPFNTIDFFLNNANKVNYVVSDTDGIFTGILL